MNTNDDDEIFTRDLMQNAGPRPSLPADDLAAITSAARAVWQERYARPKHRFAPARWILPVAAAIVIGIGLAVWTSTRPPVVQAPFAVVVASVERMSGSVALPPGESLFAGAVVETGDGTSRAALRLRGGQSLRLDARTRVRLVAPALIDLQRGALYVDSTQLDKLTIRTVAGRFTPIGTQFEVRVEGGATQLLVREGRVALDRAQGQDIAAAGERLSVAADGKVARAHVRADDPRWQWVVDVARVPAIEGRTLEWFLRQCAREKGWKIEFADRDAAALASAAILHGSVDTLSMDEALRSVALSSGVDYRVRDGVLIIRVD